MGIHAADQSLHTHRHHILGQFIYVLDDDDYLVDKTFVEDLKEVVQIHDPQIIMVKVHFPQGIFPEPWGEPPQMCRIGAPNFVVERVVWKNHIESFHKNGHDGRAGDFNFIDTLFSQHYRIHWWDRIVAKVPRVGLGKGEN